jgi:catechol 2,3-dioxygenase-like lactoylglutathione lyase family enzyme
VTASAHLDLVSLIVPEYDSAIRFFVGVLQFELVEDRASETTDGRAKRWVVVRPPGGGTGFVLARADNETQRAAVGAQWAGRVGLFLRVSNFDATRERLREAGIVFEGEPRAEAYGQVIVFRDPFGNRWDLLSPYTL